MNEFVARVAEQAPEPSTGETARPHAGAFPTKVKPLHLSQLAIVYVRQSTQQQVLEHRESTARQYALVDERSCRTVIDSFPFCANSGQ